ncbi:MAG: histidinol-phosphate transaminase [Thermoprotei archaeon]
MNNMIITNILKQLDSVEGYEKPKYYKDSMICLDKNENFFIDKKFLIKLAIESLNEIDLRLYPEGEYEELINALSKFFNMDNEWFMIGFGSDQLIDILTEIFAQNNMVVSIAPTFSWYRLRTLFHGGTYIDVPLNNDFSLNLNKLLEKSRNASLTFICSPNNPTGNQFSIDDIKSIVEEAKGLVVIDEAYVDFADFSVYNLVKKYENLIVLRTFSKAYGLAGLRLGYMIAQPEIIKPLFKTAQYPYPITNFSAKIATKLIQNIDVVKTAISKLKNEREKLYNELLKLNIKVYRSNTNFLLFRSPINPEIFEDKLIKNGIKIKRIKDVLGQNDFFRVTVGLSEMNAKFLEVIKNVIQ